VYKKCLEFNRAAGDFLEPPPASIGVAVSVMRGGQTVNVNIPRYHPNFSFSEDPLPDEPLLVESTEFEAVMVAVALRGRVVNEPFSVDDVAKMKAVLPSIARSLVFATRVGCKAVQVEKALEVRLAAVLDKAAVLMPLLKFEDLFFAIQDRTGVLVNAQRFRLMLYDQMLQNMRCDLNLGTANAKD